MQRLSVTFGKKYVCKFSAISHGKGVVDGVDGNVKQLVRQKTKSRGKDRVVVQDTFTFANEAKKLTKETEVIYVSTEEVLQFSQDNPFEDCVVIPGISKMRVISVISEKASFWR